MSIPAMRACAKLQEFTSSPPKADRCLQAVEDFPRQVTGDWDNAGTFNAGTSTVQMVDGCGLSSAVIAGETTFANLDMTTMAGFLYSFMAGLTQMVTNSLTLLGEEGSLLTLRSTLSEVDAFVEVQGSSSSDFVDIQDVVLVPEPDPTVASIIAIGTILLLAGFRRR